MSNGTFYLFLALCFKGSSYHGLIANSMEPFQFISNLFSGAFDLFPTLYFGGSNYLGLIASSMEPFELILGLSNGPFDLNTRLTL